LHFSRSNLEEPYHSFKSSLKNLLSWGFGGVGQPSIHETLGSIPSTAKEEEGRRRRRRRKEGRKERGSTCFASMKP
jgi:hypothetical protein